VTIAAAHTVTIDTPVATSSGTTINGILTFSRVTSSTLTIVSGDLTVASGGWLDMGTEANPIPSASSATLILAYGSSVQYGLTVSDGGNFTVRGSTKTPATFGTSSVHPGGTQVTVLDTGNMGWTVGDEIVLAKTTPVFGDASEAVRITNLASWPTITFTPAVSYGHYPGSAPMRVGNLSRNVLIRSSGAVVGTDTAYIRNLATNTTSFDLRHGEFAYLGANTSPRYGITFDGDNARGFIPSSTTHRGYRTVWLNADANTLSNNV
jgi:hypothetical protein